MLDITHPCNRARPRYFSMHEKSVEQMQLQSVVTSWPEQQTAFHFLQANQTGSENSCIKISSSSESCSEYYHVIRGL